MSRSRAPRLLVATWSRDSAGVDRVLELLRERGADVLRFDTDLYPSQYRLSTGAGGHLGNYLDGPHGSWDLSDLDGLWFRRDFTAYSSPADLIEPSAQREAREAVRGLWSVAAPFVLDPVSSVERAGHKLLQLRLAQEIGLDIPETLVSNDADRVAAFAHRLGGVVAKMHNSDLELDENDRPVRVYTTALSPEQVEAFEGWSMGPLIFQEKIPKATELRVVLVEDEVYTISLSSQGIEGAEQDWRAQGEKVVETACAVQLPEELVGRLSALRKRLDLRYGAVDLIHTPDDRYVFLEYNPVGGFEFLEGVYGDRIPSALADCLLRGCREQAGQGENR